MKLIVKPLIFCWLLLSLFTQSLNAQTNYPERPIRMVVAWPAGGGTDSVARIVARYLGERLGQSVVVENRSGASGIIGTEFVARAEPDGYTIQYTVADSHSINPHVFPNIRFDALADFTPVAMVGSMPNALIVNPKVSSQTLNEFIQIAREKPNQLTYGSWGVGSGGHIRMESFNIFANIKTLHVPYQGSPPAMQDLVAGNVQMIVTGLLQLLPLHQSGRVKIIGVGHNERIKAYPDIPTIAETVPGYTVTGFLGIGAPKDTPAEIVQRLNREIVAVLNEPAIKAKMLELNSKPFTTTPAEFAKFTAEEADKWGKVVKAAGVKVE